MKVITLQRLLINIQGLVQGVGFRPFIYRLAGDLNLNGWVGNSPQGVQIEAEGDRGNLERFVDRLDADKPPLAMINNKELKWLDPVGYEEFTVRMSGKDGGKTALVLPDIATCPDCLDDIFDTSNRRYRYPFTNCTNCGPRYSIIKTLPYDRGNTTMRIFPMCKKCREEYEDPANRRFHAQPNACLECGPHLELWDINGNIFGMHDEALLAACDAVKQGRILALKGLGGFQLIVDARNDDAVRLLRGRKGREEKPFALMYHSLEAVNNDCLVSDIEKKLLISPQAPITLLRKQKTNNIADSAAPGNPYLGVMLPYTPLHHLLMHELRFPIVATSGNLTGEPICIDEHEALARLKGVADLYLVHNRPIARQVDDSVVRVMHGYAMVIRNARGYAPTPIRMIGRVKPCLAVGGHLKNSVAIAREGCAFASQHIGDLETVEAYEAMKNVAVSLSDIYDFKPESVVSDFHPDYLSTRFAAETSLPMKKVQHHVAHVLACMADNDLDEPVLGISWDGTGLGPDRTIWGGEFIRINGRAVVRAAHFRLFPLPGGDSAIREPRRTALGLLYEIYGADVFGMNELKSIQSFDNYELDVLRSVMKNGINSPMTSSAGRLFDAVSSILGFCQVSRYEGQAAMMLEYAGETETAKQSYHFEIRNNGRILIIDWEPIIHDIISDLYGGVVSGRIASRFQNTMADITLSVTEKVGEKNVALTGGCFQNRYLTERVVRLLDSAGYKVYRHHRIPPNDGGIAVGQIVAAAREMEDIEAQEMDQ